MNIQDKVEVIDGKIKLVAQVKPRKALSFKESKLMARILAGDSNTAALSAAGYSPKSLAVIHRLREHISEAEFAEESRVKSQTMTKDDVIGKLKSIIETNDEDRVKILAINTLVKMLGYEAPLRVDQQTQQTFILRIVDDQPPQGA